MDQNPKMDQILQMDQNSKTRSKPKMDQNQIIEQLQKWIKYYKKGSISKMDQSSILEQILKMEYFVLPAICVQMCVTRFW